MCMHMCMCMHFIFIFTCTLSSFLISKPRRARTIFYIDTTHVTSLSLLYGFMGLYGGEGACGDTLYVTLRLYLVSLGCVRAIRFRRVTPVE